MKTVTAGEMRALDLAASAVYGIPALLLMENAGRGAAEFIRREYASGTILVLCGKGNNGGDGFVAARHLWNGGFSVEVALLAEVASLKGDALLNWDILEKMNVPRRVFLEPGLSELCDKIRQAGFLVDAILGIGVHSNLSSFFTAVVQAVNDSGKPVLAVDIPTGLDADTGEVHGAAVKASMTAAMGLLKQGMKRGEGPLLSGRIEVIDIGLPVSLLGGQSA